MCHVSLFFRRILHSHVGWKWRDQAHAAARHASGVRPRDASPAPSPQAGRGGGKARRSGRSQPFPAGRRHPSGGASRGLMVRGERKRGRGVARVLSGEACRAAHTLERCCRALTPTFHDLAPSGLCSSPWSFLYYVGDSKYSKAIIRTFDYVEPKTQAHAKFMYAGEKGKTHRGLGRIRQNSPVLIRDERETRPVYLLKPPGGPGLIQKYMLPIGMQWPSGI